MKLSIVVPVYNEKETITSILALVEKEISQLEGITDHQIVLIDDCSTDGSRAVLEKYIAGKEHYALLLHEENRGKGGAIKTGIKHTDGDIVLIQDADLEYDPHDYSVLLGPILRNKADVVYGSRFKGEISRVLYFWHYAGNRLLTLLSNMLTNLNLTDMETCYKVFKGDIIRNMILSSERFGIEPEMTAKIAKIEGIRIYEVPISYFGRTYEEGKKINWKDGFSAIWCILKFNLFTSEGKSFSRAFLSTRKDN